MRSSLDHQLRAPSQGYLEWAIEQVLRRQRNKRCGSLDGDAAVTVGTRDCRTGVVVRVRGRDGNVGHSEGRLPDGVRDVHAEHGVSLPSSALWRRGVDPWVAFGSVHDRVARAFARGVRERVLLPHRAGDVEEAGDDEEHQWEKQRELDERLSALVFAVAEEANEAAQ